MVYILEGEREKERERERGVHGWMDKWMDIYIYGEREYITRLQRYTFFLRENRPVPSKTYNFGAWVAPTSRRVHCVLPCPAPPFFFTFQRERETDRQRQRQRETERERGGER